MTKRVKSKPVVESDSDVPPVEMLSTPVNPVLTSYRLTRYSSSPNDESPTQKPPPKKSKAVDPSDDDDDVVIVEPPPSVRSSSRKSTKAKVPKSVAVKEEPSEDVVSGKRIRTASRHAQEAAEANNLASDSDKTPVKVRTNSGKGSRPKSAVWVEYNPNVTFKVGSAKVLKASSEAEDDSHVSSETEGRQSEDSSNMQGTNISSELGNTATKSSRDDGQLTPAAPALSGNKRTQRRNSYEVDDDVVLDTPKGRKPVLQSKVSTSSSRTRSKSLRRTSLDDELEDERSSSLRSPWNPAARCSTIDEDSDRDIVSPTPKYKGRSQSTKRDTLSAVEGAETRGSARFSSKQSKNKKPSLTDSDEDVAVATKSRTSSPIKRGKDRPQAANPDSYVDQEEAIARHTTSPSKRGRVQPKDGSESDDVFTDRRSDRKYETEDESPPSRSLTMASRAVSKHSSGKERKSKGTKSDDQQEEESDANDEPAKRSRSAPFGYPKMSPGDIPLFGSEYSDMPDAVMADQYTSFTWARTVVPLPFGGASRYRHIPRPVTDVLDHVRTKEGRIFVDGLNFKRTDKIVNPARCNPSDFELSTDPPVGTSTSVANIGSERHVRLRKTQKPVVFIYTGILSEVSHLVELMHKNVNTQYVVTVVRQIALEVYHIEFQLLMSFMSYVLNHWQHPDNTRSLTLQLQPPTDNCPWSGVVFASPRKGASTRGSTTGPLNPFQRRLLAESPKKVSGTEKWEVPVSFRTFDDGVPIYDGHKDSDFQFDAEHLDDIPKRYPLYKKGHDDLYPGSLVSVLYQYGIYTARPGEPFNPASSPCVQLHPVMVLVHT
ncbi:hypothetical protein ARMGADRAFT_1085483 [Armillaria gallica]|uniref:Uncharacterized protein n=1 Tax=Armillaria gallica TaxID=47427 RepID=A0A2H3DGT1_ARMGA|nr:hypothetical protein ARMGADRAFT_1085483 [Armillaria gallica]